MASCLAVSRDSLSSSTPTSIPTSAPSRFLISSNPSNRKPSSDPSYFSNSSIFRSRLRPTTLPSKRSRNGSQEHKLYEELHQSTCLNLNASDNSDSDLWILPDFEEWEYDEVSLLAHSNPNFGLDIGRDGVRQNGTVMTGQIEWAPLVQRAASSNHERLRRRLEGDGWDFVGGKHGYENGNEEWRGSATGSEESVDEEFDVVILPPGIVVT